MIGATGVRAPRHLEVHSNQDIAYVTVGTEDGSRHASGLNVTVIDAKKGTIVDSQAFSWSEGGRMSRFLERVPRGRVVVVATKGGIPASVDKSVCNALTSIGADGCPLSGTGGYALIGVKGATAGSALQASGEDAYLRIAPDRRSLSAAVDWVRLQRLP